MFCTRSAKGMRHVFLIKEKIMPRVVCIKCKDIGYTASPEHVRCECGGKLAAALDDPDEIKQGGNENESIANS